jgi:hypothetical protein
MNFIVGLILIIFIFKLVFWLASRMFVRYARKQNLFNQTTEEETKSKPNKKTRDKIFNKNQGDYVDFEELDKK